VNKAIFELLAFDFKSFRYSTYVAQKELTLIQDSTKRQDRRAVINNMLGIDVIERTRKNFPSKIKVLEKDFESVEREFNNVRERIEELEQKQADFKKSVGEHKRIQDELAKKEKNLKEVEQRVKQFQQYKDLSSRIESKKEILTGIEKSISKTEKNIQEIAQAKKDLEKFEEQLNDFKDVDEKLNKQKTVRKQFDEFLDRLETVKQIVAEKAKHAAVEFSKAQKEKENLEGKKESITKHIEELELIQIDETKVKGLEYSYRRFYRIGKKSNAKDQLISSLLFFPTFGSTLKGLIYLVS
jgi:DNA repair exonuclease SbcCD ATPase subunit